LVFASTKFTQVDGADVVMESSAIGTFDQVQLAHSIKFTQVDGADVVMESSAIGTFDHRLGPVGGLHILL